MAVSSSMPKTRARWRGPAPLSESLFELAVDAEPFEGSGEVAGGPGGPELAGRAEFDGGLLGDQQVGVRRVRPAAAAVVEPVQDSAAGEVVEQADVAADGDAQVTQVDVAQLHGADHLRPCRVDGGQGDPWTASLFSPRSRSPATRGNSRPCCPRPSIWRSRRRG
jgi:uncharacterized membrane protein